jgi:hypothetical protein
LPGPPWLLQEAGRSEFLPVHWPDLPAPLPPWVGGDGLAPAIGAVATPNATVDRATANSFRVRVMPRPPCIGAASYLLRPSPAGLLEKAVRRTTHLTEQFRKRVQPALCQARFRSTGLSKVLFEPNSTPGQRARPPGRPSGRRFPGDRPLGALSLRRGPRGGGGRAPRQPRRAPQTHTFLYPCG